MWEHRGIKGSGDAPSYLGKFKGNLIIIGGARCVWDDYTKLTKSGFQGSVMAVNDIGLYFDKMLNHWVSMHANYLVQWVALRRGHSMLGHECLTHTREPHAGIRVAWDIQPYGWTSGTFAAQVAIALGYESIVLCGVPQDGMGRFFDPPWMPGGEHDDKNSKKAFRNIVENCPELKRCVRSMSGWTKGLFGEPGTD
jgi:hypothetical protein